MTDKDLAEALGRGPGVPADDEIDTTVIEKPPVDDGDGDVGTEGRGPG